MKIKNYTTSVPAEKSIIQIEKILVDFGATHIMKEYENNKVKSIAFRVDKQGYLLPANVEGVYNTVFTSDNHQFRESRKKRAYQIAWRVLKDWIHSQLSIIAVGQAEVKEVLLPFMWDGKRTLYEAYKDGTIKLEHKEEEIVDLDR